MHTLSLKPNWAQKGIEPLAGQIDAYAREQFGSRRFDLVGFSLGGLVSRYYVQRLGGLRTVWIISSPCPPPHHGTAFATFAHLIPNRGCREMRPGSPFLRDLAQDADELRRF